jgi:histidyl-tRNA synthetase
MDVLVFALEDSLQLVAVEAAQALRRAGMAVDLQLEARKAKVGRGDHMNSLRLLFAAPSHMLCINSGY